MVDTNRPSTVSGSAGPGRVPSEVPTGSRIGDADRRIRPPRPQPAPQRVSRPAPAEQPREERAPAHAQPWSEVPPEVQELLRAEIARRQAASAARAAASQASAAAEEAQAEAAAAVPEEALAESLGATETGQEATAVVPQPAVSRSRTTRGRRRTADAAAGDAGTSDDATAAATGQETVAEPGTGAKHPRRGAGLRPGVAGRRSRRRAPSSRRPRRPSSRHPRRRSSRHRRSMTRRKRLPHRGAVAAAGPGWRHRPRPSRSRRRQPARLPIPSPPGRAARRGERHPQMRPKGRATPPGGGSCAQDAQACHALRLGRGRGRSPGRCRRGLIPAGVRRAIPAIRWSGC